MNVIWRVAVLLPVLAALGIVTAGCARPAIRTCHTPGGRCLDAVAAEIGTARSEVLVQASALTARQVTDALAAARDAGASVAVVLDRSAPLAQNSATYLVSVKGIPTFLDGRHGIAGSNIIVIDRSTVITGSMPFTQEAEVKDANNLLIIASEEAAGPYVSSWHEHRAHAEEFSVIIAPPKPEPVKEPPKKEKKKKTVKKKGTAATKTTKTTQTTKTAQKTKTP